MYKIQSYFIAIAYSFAIGFSPLFLKKAIGLSNPTLILAHRFLIASIVIVWMNKNTLKAIDFIKVFPLSLLFPIGTFMFQTFALQTTSTLQLSMIQSFVPVFTLIGSYFVWKDKITYNQIFFVGLSTLGIVWIMIHEVQLSFTIGLIFALFTAISWAVYTILIRYYLKQYDSVALSVMNVTNAMVLYNLFAVIFEKNYIKVLFQVDYFIVIVYLAIIATAFSVYAMVDMVKHIGTFQASVFTNLSTVIAMVAGSLILQEKLQFYHFIGIAMVIVGVIFSNRR